MALVGWLDTTDPLVITWLDAPSGDELRILLASAYAQCLAFAPELATGAAVPDNYKLAQFFQTKALYRSQLAGSGDQIGADGMSVTVFPMDWTVKNLLRPKKVGRVL